MSSIGVRGKVLSWVREWLTDRTQKVVLNGKESGTGNVRSGVVQGSTLGPTLFLIFINDISSAVNDGESALELGVKPSRIRTNVSRGIKVFI